MQRPDPFRALLRRPQLAGLTLWPYLLQGGVGTVSGVVAGERGRGRELPPWGLLWPGFFCEWSEDRIWEKGSDPEVLHAWGASAGAARRPRTIRCRQRRHALPFPHALNSIPSCPAPASTDKLLARGWSVRSVRRVLQAVGMLGPAACLLLAVSPLTDGSPSAASAYVSLGLGLNALTLGAVSLQLGCVLLLHLTSVCEKAPRAVFYCGTHCRGALELELQGLASDWGAQPSN